MVCKNGQECEPYSPGTVTPRPLPSGEGATWGDITGTLSDQTDLQTALDAIDTRIDDIELAEDVIFVVSTKADLDAHSTAGVTLNDIAKVLNDETHNNAISYYKWNGTTWDYMTSVGPFYTKTETNTLLAEKVATTTFETRTDGLTFLRLTQAEYDALTTKDANTFYIIEEE